MASNSNAVTKFEPWRYNSTKPVKCCLHGYRCSIALKTMSTETLTRSEPSSSNSLSRESQKPPLFRLQRANSAENSPVNEDNSAFPLKRYYLGIVTPQTAELFVSRNTAFRVYHSLRDISDEKLLLCIVYKNSRGEFYHYLIKERFDEKLRTNLLYVDYGDDECPEFIGIESLIKYYTIYASLQSFSPITGLHADVFPWWYSSSKT